MLGHATLHSAGSGLGTKADEVRNPYYVHELTRCAQRRRAAMRWPLGPTRPRAACARIGGKHAFPSDTMRFHRT